LLVSLNALPFQGRYPILVRKQVRHVYPTMVPLQLDQVHLLESFEELHEEWKRMSTSDASIDGDNIQKVSNVNLVSQSKIWHCKRRYF
jgi:hypothetical protein